MFGLRRWTRRIEKTSENPFVYLSFDAGKSNVDIWRKISNEENKKTIDQFEFCRMICYDMHQAFVLKFRQRIPKIYTWIHVILQIRIKNGFGRNVYIILRRVKFWLFLLSRCSKIISTLFVFLYFICFFVWCFLFHGFIYL